MVVKWSISSELGGKNDLEQASALFEVFIAELQRQGVTAIENIAVTCDPIREGAVLRQSDQFLKRSLFVNA